jgi:NAD(P)-dependent dehydrogenase (short-subunit alcohol dehydrogenase family)
VEKALKCSLVSLFNERHEKMSPMRNLEGKVAFVTGGTFGVGRGIASVLAQHGAQVFVTGRSAGGGVANDEQITLIRCDHRVDAEVSAAFERIAREAGKVDILVNNVWGGYERMVRIRFFLRRRHMLRLLHLLSRLRDRNNKKIE